MMICGLASSSNPTSTSSNKVELLNPTHWAQEKGEGVCVGTINHGSHQWDKRVLQVGAD